MVTVMNMKTRIATGALAVLVVGGSITGATVHNAQVQADAQAQHVLVLKAAKVVSDQAAADAAAQAVIDAAAAQKVLDDAAAAKAAADALAAKQAADAAAAAQVAATQAAAAKIVTTAPTKKASTVAAPTVSTGSTKVASGQPVPMMTDPGGNKYPDTTQCQSGSASNVNGVPTCD